MPENITTEVCPNSNNEQNVQYYEAKIQTLFTNICWIAFSMAHNKVTPGITSGLCSSISIRPNTGNLSHDVMKTEQ